MNKLLALVLCASALAACSDMPWSHSSSSGNTAETKNSTDANRSGNRAATSPGGGTGAGTSSGGSTGAGSR